MLIAISTYTKSLDEVEQHRNDHLVYVKNLFAQNKLLAAGRQNPLTGAVLIAGNISKDELQMLLDADPYCKENVAKYSIIEFNPVLCNESLKALLEH